MASLVCKTWLQLLRSSIFDEDTQLFVNEDLLKNETSCRFISESSRITYKKITFNNVRNVRDNKSLWNHLGKCVQAIHMNKSKGFLSVEASNFLEHFQELKDLTLILQANWKNFYQFETIPEKLERLTVVLDRYQGSLVDFHALLMKANNLTELEIDSGCFNNDELLKIIKKFSSILTKLSIILKSSDIKAFEHLNPLKKLKRLCLVLPDVQNESEIQQLLKSFANISYLEVKINGFAPVNVYANLKTLEIEKFMYDSDQLRSMLKVLTGLEKLSVDYDNVNNAEEKCFFVHERIQNNTLHSLKIYQRSSEACLACMESLSGSFPNLKEFDSNLPLMNKHLITLQQNCKYLTHLRVEWSTSDTSESLLMPVINMTRYRSFSLHSLKITNECLLNWSVMPNLTSLSINLDSSCTVEGFHEFIKNFPSLEDIRFVSHVTNEMIFVVVDFCKWLKSIASLCCKDSKVTTDGLRYVVKNCRSISKIEFHCVKNVSLEDLKRLKQGNNTIAVYTADSVKYL